MYYEVLQVQPLTVHPICEVLITGLLNDTFRSKDTNASDPKASSEAGQKTCSVSSHTHKWKGFKTSSWEEILETAPFFSPKP